MLANSSKIGWPTPCRSEVYDFIFTPLETTNNPEYPYHLALIVLSSGMVRVEETYVLMDTATFLSSVGGLLGLLLGFSCFGTAIFLMDYTSQKIAKTACLTIPTTFYKKS